MRAVPDRLEDEDPRPLPRFPHPAGAYAEYVAASRPLVAKPADLDHLQAAGLPLAGRTAWQALVDTGKVQPGIGTASAAGHATGKIILAVAA